MSNENKEKPISEQEQTRELLEQTLAKLSIDQIRFIVARLETATDKEAAEMVGIAPNTVSQWKYKGDPIDEAIRLMAIDGLVTAQHIRRRNVTKAMLVKVAGLDSKDERISQGVATEIVEWELGKAVQHTKLSGEIEVTTLTDDQRKARIKAILEQAAKRE